MKRTAMTFPPVLLQRFIILHNGLVCTPPPPPPPSLEFSDEKPIGPQQQQHGTRYTKNSQPILSEDASLEEHGEYILYYYNHSLHSISRTQPQDRDIMADARKNNYNSTNYFGSGETLNLPADHATEDAVRFAGICRALHGLPQVLQPQRNNANNIIAEVGKSSTEYSNTDVVHLTESTLIFIPLEIDGDILAIAQIPRAKQTMKIDQSSQRSRLHMRHYGVDPLAFTELIQRAHSVFSLIHGGGIHRRLLRTKRMERSKDWTIQCVGTTAADAATNDAGATATDNAANDDDNNIISNNLTPALEKVNDSYPIIHEDSDEFYSEQHLSRETFKTMLSTSVTYYSHANYYYRYGGVEELLNLRRQKRILMRELQYRTDGSLRMDRTDEWDSNNYFDADATLLLDIVHDDGFLSDWKRKYRHCMRQIDHLNKILPLTKLRADLIEFYDTQWLEMQNTCNAIPGGVGRCVVDLVPRPTYRGYDVPPNPLLYHAASNMMKSLMNDEVPKLFCFNWILSAMSLFHDNRLLLSEYHYLAERKNNCLEDEVKLSTETSYMIVEYIQRNQRKSSNDNIEHDSTQEKMYVSNPNEKLILTSISNHSTITNQATETTSTRVQQVNGDCIELAMSAYPDGSILSLYVPSINKHIKLVRIYPARTPIIIGADEDKETETSYVAMLEYFEFRFLLYFNGPRLKGDEVLSHNRMEDTIQIESKRENKPIRDTTHSIVDVLYYLADKLTIFRNTYSSGTFDSGLSSTEKIPEMNRKRTLQGVDGIDIICIDSENYSSEVLMRERESSSNKFKQATRVADATSPFKLALQRLLSKNNSPSSKEVDNFACPSLPSNCSMNNTMLDCRHKLVSHFPIEIIHALDDMFNEMRCSTSRQRGKKEICTYLPQGWVFGCSTGKIELYMILDTSKFATINDVQKAVTHVQELLKLDNDV